jgi:hypothetical protein
MKRILKIILIGWGIVSLVVVLVVAAVVFIGLVRSSGNRSGFASPRDVLFVLNWGQIPTEQKYQVLHSYQSSTSFTGDHCEAYAISIERFPDSLLQSAENIPARWSISPPTNSVFVEAVRGACVNVVSDRQEWFPSADDLLSNRFFLSFWRVVLTPPSVQSAQILAYDRTNHTLYYVSFKI